MSNKFISRLLQILVVLVLLLPAPVDARGLLESTGTESSFTFADLGQSDLTISVIYEQEFIDFPVPAGRQVDRAVLNLHLQHSEELLPDLSDIVIAVNDEPVADILLTAENAADAILPIEIPVEALKPGENELLLRISQRLVDDGCSDIGDANLWVKILADSSLTFTSQEIPVTGELSQFPLPFSTFSSVPGSPQISIVLPDSPTPAELSAVAQLSASLGQAANWVNPPLSAFSYRDLDPSRVAQDALIVVDTGARNPLAAASTPGVTLLPSPYDPNQEMLVVSGVDEAGLLRSVSMLTTGSARANLTGAHTEPANVTAQELPLRPALSSFTDLGLTTKRVRGIGLHDLYFPIDIPYDWKTTSEASVEMHFTHGTALTSASLMTIYLNGFETASVRLERRNADNGRLIIQLSPRQIHPGRNWLHIVFDLHMTRENCKYHYFEEAWAEISADQSMVNLSHVVSIAPLDLRYMPSYLVVPNDLSADLIVLPANPGQADLTAMARIAAKLGTYSESDTNHIQATTANRFSAETSSGNVIAIGSPETNSLISSYDAQLPQPLTLSAGQILPSGGRELLPEELEGQAAYLEVIPTPWSRSGTLLVIGAYTPNLLLRAVEILPTGGRRMKQEGNVAIVTATDVTGLNLGDLAGVSLSPAVRRRISAIFIGAFVLIILFGAFITIRRRRIPAEEDNE